MEAENGGGEVTVAEEGEANAPKTEIMQLNPVKGLPQCHSLRFTFTITMNPHPSTRCTPLPATPHSSQCLPSRVTSPTPTSLGHLHQVTPTITPTNPDLFRIPILQVSSLTAQCILPLNNLTESRTPVNQGSVTQHRVHTLLPADHLF